MCLCTSYPNMSVCFIGREGRSLTQCTYVLEEKPLHLSVLGLHAGFTVTGGELPKHSRFPQEICNFHLTSSFPSKKKTFLDRTPLT